MNSSPVRRALQIAGYGAFGVTAVVVYFLALAHSQDFEPPEPPLSATRPSPSVLGPCDLVVKQWKVVDGDTIEIVVPEWPEFFRPIGVRLLWIDAPETRTKDPVEKRAGLAAKAHLERMLEGATQILLTDVRRDKFFRLDARVSVKGIDLSGAQISAGHAQPYTGQGPRP